jgi:hypothetical protein
MKPKAASPSEASLHLQPVTKSSTKRGVKTQYNESYPEQAHKLCLLGAQDSDLASYFGICRKTLSNWRNTYPAFADAVMRGKKAADMEVAASLYQATLDRIITTKQAIKCKEIYYDDNGKRVEKERVEIVEVDKHIPADFRSQQFWLKNRNPKFWSDKHSDDDDTDPKAVTLNLGSGLDPYETAD